MNMIQNIIPELMKKLNITEEQAKGGLGILLQFCKDKLEPKHFDKIAGLIGPQVDEYLKLAPDAKAGMMGKLSGFASVFGEKAAQLGSMANLAGNFKKIGID